MGLPGMVLRLLSSKTKEPGQDETYTERKTRKEKKREKECMISEKKTAEKSYDSKDPIGSHRAQAGRKHFLG